MSEPSNSAWPFGKLEDSGGLVVPLVMNGDRQLGRL